MKSCPICLYPYWKNALLSFSWAWGAEMAVSTFDRKQWASQSLRVTAKELSIVGARGKNLAIAERFSKYTLVFLSAHACTFFSLGLFFSFSWANLHLIFPFTFIIAVCSLIHPAFMYWSVHLMKHDVLDFRTSRGKHNLIFQFSIRSCLVSALWKEQEVRRCKRDEPLQVMLEQKNNRLQPHHTTRLLIHFFSKAHFPTAAPWATSLRSHSKVSIKRRFLLPLSSCCFLSISPYKTQNHRHAVTEAGNLSRLNFFNKIISHESALHTKLGRLWENQFPFLCSSPHLSPPERSLLLSFNGF